MKVNSVRRFSTVIYEIEISEVRELVVVKPRTLIRPELAEVHVTNGEVDCVVVRGPRVSDGKTRTKVYGRGNPTTPEWAKCLALAVSENRLLFEMAAAANDISGPAWA